MATTYRVLSDLLYRSVATVTTANVVTEAYDTDAYGNTLCYSGPGTDGEWFTDDDVQTNNPINTTIFTGRQYDPESLIYWYRARYYSPGIGRFLSRDPLKKAERKAGPNLYAYVQGLAVIAVDPKGLSAKNCCASLDSQCTSLTKAVITMAGIELSLDRDLSRFQKELSALENESKGDAAGYVGDKATSAGMESVQHAVGYAIEGWDVYEAASDIMTAIGWTLEIGARNTLSNEIKYISSMEQRLLQRAGPAIKAANQAIKALNQCSDQYNMDVMLSDCAQSTHGFIDYVEAANYIS